MQTQDNIGVIEEETEELGQKPLHCPPIGKLIH